MGDKASKFGGSSLETRSDFEHVIDDIILPDQKRNYVVVSAPGGKPKVTDLLITIEAEDGKGKKAEQAAAEIKRRIKEIGKKVDDDASSLCDELDYRIDAREELGGCWRDYLLAFGEYASATLMCGMINTREDVEAVFLDPVEIGFRVTYLNGQYVPDPECFEEMGDSIEGLMPKSGRKRTIGIMPGFYLTKEGNLDYAQGDTRKVIITLPRNGSDISVDCLAAAVGAEANENFTDKDGLSAVHPDLVKEITGNPATVREMTYLEGRELAYRNFKMHQDSMNHSMRKQIPINIRNTKNPSHPGTWIVHDRIVPKGEHVVGVAYAAGKVPFSLAKRLMNQEKGFIRTLAEIVQEHGISLEHVTTGIDSATVYFDSEYVNSPGDINSLVRAAQEMLGPLEIGRIEPISIIAAVGQGLSVNPGGIGRAISAIEREGIMPLMVDYGPPGIGLFIGVEQEKAAPAVRAIYKEFFCK